MQLQSDLNEHEFHTAYDRCKAKPKRKLVEAQEGIQVKIV